MKLILSALFIGVILTMGINQASGEIENYDVTTSHKMVDILGQAEPQTQVFLDIFDQSENLVIDRVMTVDFDGDFRFTLGIKYFPGYGTYTVQMTHEGSTEEFNFTFKERIDPTLSDSSIEITQQDQDIERLQLQIQKQVNRITELENENFDLKKQINNLNLIIQEQIKVIMDTLLSLKI